MQKLIKIYKMGKKNLPLPHLTLQDGGREVDRADRACGALRRYPLDVPAAAALKQPRPN